MFQRYCNDCKDFGERTYYTYYETCNFEKRLIFNENEVREIKES